ncbi:Hypothetical protein CINCED_3A012631, partial [Cinara cedri]
EAKASNEKHKRTVQQKDFKEEHELIYGAFLRALKSDTLDPIGKEVATFLCGNSDNILKGVDLEKVEPLSEENFCQFLLAVFKGIKVGNLASKENLTNKKIQKLVNECISDARDTQRNDSLIQGLGWFVGIKIDPKNVASSIKKGVLNKVPFLGNKEEKNEPQKSDTELVTDVLVRVFLPIFIFVVTAIFIEVSQIMIIFGVIGLMIATGKAISSLFASTTDNLSYTPQEVQSKDWEESIINDINEILLKDLEQQPPKDPEQQTSDQKKSPSHVGTEDERRKNNSSGCPRTYS